MSEHGMKVRRRVRGEMVRREEWREGGGGMAWEEMVVKRGRGEGGMAWEERNWRWLEELEGVVWMLDEVLV